MSDDGLQEKAAYFDHQELSDKDDESVILGESYLKIGHALVNTEAMPPPKLVRHSSSFLGPPPKAQLKDFEARIGRPLPASRSETFRLKRSATAPDSSSTSSLPATKRRQRLALSSGEDPQDQLKRTASLPDLKTQDEIPFYKRMGVIPRELKTGKNAKLADNIRLEPEERQILKDKIVYFYPNDDISMPRRQRIHKLIQLGAAWVKTWRGDITHIIVDESSHTYSSVLRQLNKPGLLRRIVLVKFDPYVPQCIQFGTLLDPTAGRFLVKGAPNLNQGLCFSTQISQSSESQGSLQIKPSQRQLATHQSQKTDSAPTENSAQLPEPNSRESPQSPENVVRDSFVFDSTIEYKDKFDDPLSEAIQQTKAIAHLPLDEEEEGDLSSIDQSSDAGTDDELPGRSPKQLITSNFTPAAPKGKGAMPRNAFQCMNPLGNTSTANPNARTIEILDQMGRYYDQMQDTWRTLAYRKAVTMLRKQDIRITTAKEASALPFIGPRLADKIEEIVLTNRLRRLDSTRDDPMDQVLRLFQGVYGAGLAQASKWMTAGYRTLDDLRTKAQLTGSQKIGLDHYEDFAQRIPRAEVEEHGDVVVKTLRKIDPDFEATVMGSYRRGARDSGDIDIIITKNRASVQQLREVVFGILIPSLTKSGFLKCKLATSSRTEDGTKWHGVSCLPRSTTWRRLDLLLVPDYEMGAAFLYFTGNDIFNRSIRLLASRKGMRLNQRGLYKNVIRGRYREKLTEGTLVEGRSERKIFEILGVPWREPTERIC